MDTEALLGRSLGSCLLQEVIGSGTMGVVYRAMQSRPSRNVAVKVITRAASLDIEYQIEFLDKFRGALSRVAKLEHPHIVPIYEHGDIDDLAYIVMADIQGVTLEEILARRAGQGDSGALDLSQTLRYLEQIAGALDYAHARGIIHRDIKPANIIITADERAIVADFHLTSLLVEAPFATLRLSRPGMLDYMSPELVIGKSIDARADIYSLGAMLYRMVTGSPLFQGQTLMKIATKHLKVPPPSPRALRPDLPIAVEQAILKALEKQPEDRYEHARDLAQAFREALQGSAPAAHPAQPRPASRRPSTPRASTTARAALASELAPISSSTDALSFGRKRVAQARKLQSPALATDAHITLEERERASTGPVNAQPQETAITGEIDKAMRLHQAVREQELSTRKLTRELPSVALAAGVQENTGTTGTLKLTSPARLVSIPVAGQPGQYVTGILPKQPLQEIGAEAPAQVQATRWSLMWKKFPVLALAALLVVFILLGSLGFWFAHSVIVHAPEQLRSGQTAISGTPGLNATATAQAMATLEANTILFDPLSQNIRNWPVMTSGTLLYQFKGQAYHITDNDPSRIANAILPGVSLNQPFAYTLTMEEIRGDDTSINNEFGMIIRFTMRQANGKQIVSFYSFEVLDKKGGEYQFWKYDNSSGTNSPWNELAHHPVGGEFHQGQGARSVNTFKILVNGKNFTLIVNGKQVWGVSDTSLTSGGVGMLVNLKGTEVAFSDLRLTHN